MYIYIYRNKCNKVISDYKDYIITRKYNFSKIQNYKDYHKNVSTIVQVKTILLMRNNNVVTTVGNTVDTIVVINVVVLCLPLWAFTVAG